MRARFLTFSACSAVALSLAPSGFGADFIRGDANGDGVVTISDSHVITRFLFLTGQGITCGDAADFDNNGEIQLTDAIKNLQYQVLLGQPPAAPFPAPGADSTSDPELDQRWPCTSFGGGEPLDDPAASIRILDVTVAGGEERLATILLAVSNSVRVAGYFAELDAGGIISPTQLTKESVSHGIYDLTGTLNAGFAAAVSDPATDRLRLGFLSTFIGEVWIPPGENEIVLEVHVCLEPGTPAGVYPLDLTAGELVDLESGRRIDAALIDGTLTVVDGIPAEDCNIEPSRPDSRSQLDIVFELGETSGAPGSEVAVPFLVTTSDAAASHGLTFSIDFDETNLELAGIDTVFQRPDGKPWVHEDYQSSSDDLKPGDNVDEGYAVGRYLLDRAFPSLAAFPFDQEFTALSLRFRIRGNAAPGTADVAFRDGPEFCFPAAAGQEPICYQLHSRLLAGQVELSPELVSSFVLINGLINIVPDVTVFRRGDSNGDQRVDLSDAQTTLSYLFLGSRRPYCLDAADANDDGRLDISDPIETLGFLFLGRAALPPPTDEPGEDPTQDNITCSSIE